MIDFSIFGEEKRLWTHGSQVGHALASLKFIFKILREHENQNNHIPKNTKNMELKKWKQKLKKS